MEQPYYRLRQLIKEKYGEDKFSTGCQLVKQWLCHATKTFYIVNDIRNWCNIHNDVIHELTEQEAKALRQLFNLQRNEELYTDPQTTPEHLKTKPHAKSND